MKKFRYKLKVQLLPLLKRLRFKKYCKTSLNGLDDKLEKYLDFQKGIFIEAGANDGVMQSNTYYLESIKNWTGILVEPIPDLFEKCIKNRPDSQCFQVALVSEDFSEAEVLLEDAGLMSSVSSESGNNNFSQEYVNRGRDIQQLQPRKIRAKAETLSQIITRAGSPSIDFLSLDLEGYEVEALRGLDLNRHAPRYILVEVRDPEKIHSILEEKYDRVESLTLHPEYEDILYKRKDDE